MAKRQTSLKSFHAVTGALLLSLGLLLFFSNLEEAATQVGSFAPTGTSLTTVVELGLAGMRAVESYFLDHPTFQASLHAILVSLWPLLLVILGATLLRNAVSKRYTNSRWASSFASKEYENEW